VTDYLELAKRLRDWADDADKHGNKMVPVGPQSLRKAADELERAHAELAAERKAREHDAHAYRGSLGYPVPGDHNGRLMSGETPNNGMSEAVVKYRAEPAERRAEEAENLLRWLADENFTVNDVIAARAYLKRRRGSKNEN